MNICYISNLYPPAVLGGAEIVVQKMANQVAKTNNVIVITTSPDEDYHKLEKDNTTIYQLNTTKLYPVYKQTGNSGIRKPLWHLFDLWNNNTKAQVKEILEYEDIDVVHINNYKGLSLSVFSAVKELDIPLLFMSHDFSLICPRANLIKGDNTLCSNPNIICKNYINIQRRLLDDNVDLFVAPSNFMIEKYRDNNYFRNTPSMKIPLGVDYESRNTTKSYDTIDITYIGTLGKHKGVDTLIKAFMGIEDPNICLHIIGKGYDEEEFKKLASCDKRIIFHGFIDNSNLQEYYELSNIIVIPSICYDNSPLVIYESYSNTTPVIGSRIGGIPELIEDGVDGLLFNPGDVDSLREKLLEIINNKELLRKLVSNCSNSLPDSSMDVMINQLID
ncbi:MAG: glycosyltransferase family 4 protein, partial [Methanosphaera sp.]|nr:glycosyltransferase family 4 protein [Methanosphaera sp.]